MVKAEKILFSYNLHGNVDTLLQDFGNSTYPNIMNQAGHRFKRIAYNYDLISGKVNMVSYQPGYVSPVTNQWVTNADRFYHRYSYDAENKLTDVYTSHDSLIWERDANYTYYKHGPLARTVLGQQQVQGVDYAYNLQGWLKGVNATAVNDGSYDMGGDGKISGVNGLVARDAYGFSLNYFSTVINSVTVSDYKAINGAITPFTSNVFDLTNTDASTVAKPLFNGNIASMMVNILKLGDAQLYGYAYDQLNRIISMDAFGGFANTNNTWTSGMPTASSNYKERITYDANGNIKTYLRNGTTTGGTALAMDNLTYGYNISGGKLVNNRLRHVKDAIGDANYTDDIDNQPDENYTYDAMGNLKTDTKEGISNIGWSLYGKILSISKTSGTVTYTYDANGNRLSKVSNGKTTFYVRDASGNVLSVYEQRSDLNNGHLTQSEVHLYGTKRIGINSINRDMTTLAIGEITVFERGRKAFEVSNHLNSTLVSISDRKIAVSSGGTIIDYYTPDIVSAADYFVFGSDMPGRKFGQSARYGFSGKERSNEIATGSYDFGDRVHDARLGRWLSVDPLQAKYPQESPYTYVGNNPVFFVDIKGRFKIKHLTGKDRDAALKVIEAIRTEVDSWKDESDPRFQAFQAATGVPDIKFIKDKILKDGKGPEFHWGDASTFKPKKGEEQSHPTLMKGNGGGFEENSSYAITTGPKMYFDEGLKAIALEVIGLESAREINGLTKHQFMLGDGSRFSAQINADISGAMMFLSRVGLHEVVHKASGMAKIIRESEGTTGNIILSGGEVHERGTFFELMAYGVELQYNDPSVGTIPLRKYSLRSKWCQLPNSCQPQSELDKKRKEVDEKERKQIEEMGCEPAGNNEPTKKE
ncbi:MAG: RHS repeat-associated core domain-containing protein [Bacteroidota bacterium]|nr:RHS repeat-associated core domain-containing protein [Bacteroidota bacterium]